MRHHVSVARQCALLVCGLAVAGFGVALTTCAELGTSPISSLPLVAHYCVPPLSFGMTTFFINLLFVATEVALLGRKFPPLQFAQVAVVFVFGMFIDLGMWVCSFWSFQNYALRMVEVILGSVVLSLGIALQIHANLVFNPGEGCVKALCQVFHARFAWVKIAFDVSLVMIALFLSLAALHGVFGLREGTLVAAFAVGLSLRWAMPLCRPIKKLLLIPTPRALRP